MKHDGRVGGGDGGNGHIVQHSAHSATCHSTNGLFLDSTCNKGENK